MRYDSACNLDVDVFEARTEWLPVHSLSSAPITHVCTPLQSRLGGLV
jgi:hypothetical protein